MLHSPFTADNNSLIASTGRIHTPVTATPSHQIQSFLCNRKQMRLHIAFPFSCVGLENVVTVSQVSPDDRSALTQRYGAERVKCDLVVSSEGMEPVCDVPGRCRNRCMAGASHISSQLREELGSDNPEASKIRTTGLVQIAQACQIFRALQERRISQRRKDILA